MSATNFAEAMRSPGHETCHHRIYSLECSAYEALLARAAGCCELCKIPTSQIYRGKLLIDHESRMGWEAVRGLICARCNSHMRFVDVGERSIDVRTFAYLDLSGHFVTPGFTGWRKWAGSSVAVRDQILAQLNTGGPSGMRIKPRLACAPQRCTAS